jgi:hypothetical protein
LAGLGLQGIVERGDAEGVGALLRGYYRDHGRFMSAEELGLFQNVLTCSSRELEMYLSADLVKCVGRTLLALSPTPCSLALLFHTPPLSVLTCSCRELPAYLNAASALCSARGGF